MNGDVNSGEFDRGLVVLDFFRIKFPCSISCCSSLEPFSLYPCDVVLVIFIEANGGKESRWAVGLRGDDGINLLRGVGILVL